MIDKRGWEEFREAGLLWWINTILHMFGWAIVYDFDEDMNIVDVYPARVKYRGFDEKSNSVGYIKVTNYLKENINTLLAEAKDE